MNRLKIIDVRVCPGDSGFLLDDGQTAVLYDSGFGFTGAQLADNIQKHLGSRKLDYIFLTHSHYDHVLGSAHVLQCWPDAKVVAGGYAAGVFQRPGAIAVMRELDRKYADAWGAADYADLAGNLRVDIPVGDGDVIRAGSMEFTAVELPGHTRCSVGFYNAQRSMLLGTETLGVYNSEDDVVPSYLVGYRKTLDAIDRAAELAPDAILVPHYGVLEGQRAQFYLRRARESAVRTAQWVRASLRTGKPKAQIAEEFMNSIRHGHMRRIYPPDAMALNTKIMIDMLEREPAED